MSTEPSIGWASPELERELPRLRIATIEASLAPRLSPAGGAPAGVRARLASLSDRFNGAKAVNLRREPVTAAYRVFFRHIGIDPDVVPTPTEAAVLERMLDGAFLPSGLLADVLLIAMLDTGVPVWALDADTLEGELGIRTSRQGELLGAAGMAGTAADCMGDEAGRQDLDAQLSPGHLVVADSRCALALLFSQPAMRHRPKKGTRRLLLYALQVEGVPWLAVEESLWIACSALEAVR